MARKYLTPTGQVIAETGAYKYLGPSGAVVAETQSTGAVTVAFGSGSLTYTGNQISVTQPTATVVTFGSGSISLTGNQIAVNQPRTVTLGTGSLRLTGNELTVVGPVVESTAAGRIKPKPSKRRVLVDGKLMELTPAELGKVVKKRIAQAEARTKPDEAPKPVEVEVLPVTAKKGADVVDEPREVYRAPSVAISMPAEFVPDFQVAAPDVMARIIEQHRARIEFEAAQEAEKARRRRNEQALAILMLTL